MSKIDQYNPEEEISEPEMEKIFTPVYQKRYFEIANNPHLKYLKNVFYASMLSGILLLAQHTDSSGHRAELMAKYSAKPAVKISVQQRTERKNVTISPEKQIPLADRLIQSQNIDQAYEILRGLQNKHGEKVHLKTNCDASAYTYGQKYLINGQKVELCADQSRFERGYSLAIDPDSGYYGWYALASYVDYRSGGPTEVYLGFWKCTDTGAEETIKDDGKNTGELRNYDFSFSDEKVCQIFGLQPSDGRGVLKIIMIPPGVLDNQAIARLKSHKLKILPQIEQNIQLAAGYPIKNYAQNNPQSKK